MKAKAFNANIMRGVGISVDTFQGNVTLTGAVENEKQRESDGHRRKCLWGAQGK